MLPYLLFDLSNFIVCIFFDILKPIIDRAIELGVITDWFLFCDNSMRIAPPLIITDEQIRDACTVILQAIEVR